MNNNQGIALKAKCFDIDSDKDIAIINEASTCSTERGSCEVDVSASDRILLTKGRRSIVSIVDLSSTLVKRGEIGLFNATSRKIGAKNGDVVTAKPTEKPVSVDYIRKKMDGQQLNGGEIGAIIRDVMSNMLSDVELASFISSVYIRGLGIDETVSLTEAIVASGEVLALGKRPVLDKHSIGGVCGNRVSMLLVPIVASAGLYIPKTSSRSITSPSGTADTMEVLAPVNLALPEIRRTVLKAHGCIAWGGAVNLAAADDRLIKIRNPLRLDPRGVLLASILAKKKAVGAEYVLIDIPIGRGAKIDNEQQAKELAREFIELGSRLRMRVECVITDGTDPIGRSVGPSLEAREVLRALAGDGPSDLHEKSCQLSGILLEMCGRVAKGRGYGVAQELLRSGKARNKMREIIELQGGDPRVKPDDIAIGSCTHEVRAEREGRIHHIDNRAISKIARAAGAPRDKGAGIVLHVEKGDKVGASDVLFEIIAESEARLDYAIKALNDSRPVELGRMVLGRFSYVKPVEH